MTTSNTIALGRNDGSDKIRIFGLGTGGTTALCRNANNEISTCSMPLAEANNAAFLEILNNQRTELQKQTERLEQQQKQIEQQQLVIDGLRKIISQTNPNAEICREIKK